MQGRCLGRLRGQERSSLPQEPARTASTQKATARLDAVRKLFDLSLKK